ncbi:MAG: MFS transporter [Anaerolineales bacterium]
MKKLSRLAQQILDEIRSYPPQFWLIASGVLISSTGSSLIWPFQLIYISKVLGASITSSASLIAVSSSIGLLVSLLGGAVADKIGRKPLMLMAQAVHGLAYLLMSSARTYPAFLLPMALMGVANPFYATGSDAMMADLLPAEKRSSGYSILRMINNAGIAIGPGFGGYLVTRSYNLAFNSAAAGMLAYSLLLLFFARETLSRESRPRRAESFFSGFDRILRDKIFLAFVAVTAFGMIAPLMMWTLLALYTNQNYGLPENLYSWLPVTNALMCVFVQYFVTLFTRRFAPGKTIAAGMAVYALGVGSVALMSSFWGFWLSMVIMTFGELILVPTASTFVANRAPDDLRGRYMSFYWLTWGLARTLAPLVGGFINDQIAPRAVWWSGLAFGLSSAAALLLVNAYAQRKTVSVDSATLPDGS